MDGTEGQTNQEMDALTLALIIIAVAASPVIIGAFACWIEKRQKDKKLYEEERAKDLAAFRLQARGPPGNFAITLQACQLGNSLSSFKGQVSQRRQYEQSSSGSQRCQLELNGPESDQNYLKLGQTQEADQPAVSLGKSRNETQIAV